MPVAKATRRESKMASGKKVTRKARRVSTFPKTKTVGRWIHVFDDEGNVIRQIMRPSGKTRIPLAQIRENVRKVIAERLAREAEGDA